MTPISNSIDSGRSRSHLPSCDPAARTKTAEEVRGDSWGGRWPGQDCGLAPQSIFRSRDKVALDNELSYYVKYAVEFDHDMKYKLKSLNWSFVAERGGGGCFALQRLSAQHLNILTVYHHQKSAISGSEWSNRSRTSEQQCIVSPCPDLLSH